MTHSLISWDELQKRKKLMVSSVNSAHYLQCVQAVKERHPGAEIRQISEIEWQLWDGLDCLSGIHSSHYACWAEVRNRAEPTKGGEAWDK